MSDSDPAPPATDAPDLPAEATQWDTPRNATGLSRVSTASLQRIPGAAQVAYVGSVPWFGFPITVFAMEGSDGGMRISLYNEDENVVRDSVTRWFNGEAA